MIHVGLEGADASSPSLQQEASAPLMLGRARMALTTCMGGMIFPILRRLLGMGALTGRALSTLLASHPAPLDDTLICYVYVISTFQACGDSWEIQCSWLFVVETL